MPKSKRTKMPRFFQSSLYIAASLSVSLGAAHATITPAPLFTDSAVLQRQQAVPVWGTADPSEDISVSFNGQNVKTTADATGNWSLKLQPMQAGGPYSLAISGSKSEAVTLKDVLVGEVWLCSGQSNMEYPLSGMSPDAITKASIETANDPLLRFAMVARTLAATPQTKVGARWQAITPANASPFSAVSYYFARDLRAKLNIPIGIVESAFGGTFGQSWTSREALGSQESLKYYLNAVAVYTNTTYPQLLKDYNDKLPEYQKKFDADKAAYDAAKLAGTTLPARPRLPAPPPTPDKWQAAPSSLYNGMISPIIPYGIRGAVWYQGEGNWNLGYEYKTLLPTLINDWRGRWKQGDFPFYIVQLPPYQAVNPQPERSWFAEVREAQRLTALTVPNAELVVTTDVGDVKDIHPFRKEPIGNRLALLARAKVYGEKIESSGPMLAGTTVEGSQIRVKFTHADGLRTAQITERKDDGPVVATADKVMGFTIAGADGNFFNANAKIEGTTVVVSAPEVAAPVSIRYGWSQFPLANLQNSAGLWASPFETGENRWISKPRVVATNAAPATTVATNATSPQAAVSLIVNGDFSAPLTGAWFAGGKTPLTPTLITPQIGEAKEVTRAIQLVLTKNPAANPWDAWLRAANTARPIAKGDLVAMQFWARSTEPSKLNAVFQNSATFEKPIRETVNLTPQWQKFTFFGTSASAIEAGKSNFELQLGQTSGTLEVAGIRLENLGAIDKTEGQKRFAATVAPTSNVVPVAVAPAAPAAPVKLRPRQAPPYVILKLDDVGKQGNGRVPPRWIKVADFIKERKIKAGLGIICNSLEGDSTQLIKWIQEQQATGLFEFWNHGYDHKEWQEGDKKLQEFKGASYEQQKEHFLKSQALFTEKVGFPMKTFGAPFNATDENTVKAIAEIPELKIWLYADPKTPAGKVVLTRPDWLGIENPLFVPSLDRFIRPYDNHFKTECLVIQGHPNQWDDARFAEFVKIVDFLTEQKAVFVTPSEYVELKKLSTP